MYDPPITETGVTEVLLRRLVSNTSCVLFCNLCMYVLVCEIMRICDCEVSCARSPSSLDAYVFAHLAPLLKIKLPNGKLQQHLTSLNNLQQYCTNILALYFPSDAREAPGRKTHAQPDSSDLDNEPHKRRNQVLSVLFAVGAMLGYAILTGIVSIKRERPQLKNSGHDDGDEEDED